MNYQQIVQFINDNGTTYDPRVRPYMHQFVLFDRQAKLIEYILQKMDAGQDGTVLKARDVGVTWTAVALACMLCLIRNDIVIGFGTRRERQFDDTRSEQFNTRHIFGKVRYFLKHLPAEFAVQYDSSYGQIIFPGTRSRIFGEAGSDIGKGERSNLYFVDESAYIENVGDINTDCRIDVSSSMSTDFAKRLNATEPFIFSWRDDPRKNQEWYDQTLRVKSPNDMYHEIDLPDLYAT